MNYHKLSNRGLSHALATLLNIKPVIKPKAKKEIWLLDDNERIDAISRQGNVIFEYDYSGLYPVVKAISNTGYSESSIYARNDEQAKYSARNKAFTLLILSTMPKRARESFVNNVHS